MPTGFFLSLDGLDGTGKTTQCRLLVEWLREAGVPVTTAVDPGGTDIGKQLRQILLYGREHQMVMRTEALLFMASRAELVEQVIRPTLDRGEVVISDRFLLANVVYQGHAGGLDVNELWSIGRFATGGIEPDLTVIFDLPVETVRSRLNREEDRLESRGDEYRERVRAGFLRESERLAERCRVLDASASIENVQMELRRLLAGPLRSHGFPLPKS